MKTLMIITAIVIGSLLNLKAGEQEYTIGKKVSLKSAVLDETREILIYTPETYHISNQRYPVLYVLDGAAHFHHVSGIVQFLAGNGKIPEMIVVAVQNVDRTRDFSPTHIDLRPTSGGADKFLKFLDEELIPTVEKKYKAMSFRILAGHSLGGELAAYAFLKKPELFNAYIAISPFMMYDEAFILDEARAKIQTAYDNNVFFYMTIGDEPEYFQTLDEFQNIVKNVDPSGLEFKYEKISGENHRTVPHLSVYDGLSFIFSDWQLPNEAFIAGVPAIDNHYKMISEKYGFEIPTPESTLNALGYYYLNNDEMDNALAVFSENIDRFPESANVYDSYGEALEIDNKYEMAEVNYANAVRIAKNENHPNIDIYTKNLERIKGKLAFK